MPWKLKDLFSSKSSPAQPSPPQEKPVQLSADTWFERGNAQVSQQQWEPALECYREAVRADPKHAQAHAYIGNVLRQLRRLDEAMAAYDRAIAAKPDYAEVHYNRGTLLQQAGQARAALDSYESALTANPAFVEAHYNRGELLSQAGNTAEALRSFDAAIELNRGHAGAHAGRGIALMALGQPAAAVASFDAALQLRPDFVRLFSNRAQAQAKLGLFAEARASHDQAVLHGPQDAAIHFSRGCFLSDRKEWNAAIDSYQAATALNPDYADAYCNLGHAQQEAGQTDAALLSYKRALEIDPRLSLAFNNRGNLFRSTRRFEEALLDYRQAIALEPNSVEAHYNLSQLALLRGDFETGWAEYEWRQLIEEAVAASSRTLPQPAWSGETPLQGKRIFIHAEQGFGDTIQFCRYVSLVAGLGAEVTLEVPAQLGDLLTGLDGVSQLVLAGAPIPPADYQCSVMSLPRAFKTTLETIPGQVPYLRANADKVARWHEILGPRTRPRVGLVWSGNPRNRNDHTRSTTLARWIDFLPDGYEFICLQKDISDDDRRIMDASGKFTPVESYIENFTDTAALIETLDLVISVCTSVAHLSGAMGKKTWIVLSYLADWRWLLERRDTPWYPTATLYRQPAAGDWAGVMAKVKEDLLLTAREMG